MKRKKAALHLLHSFYYSGDSRRGDSLSPLKLNLAANSWLSPQFL